MKKLLLAGMFAAIFGMSFTSAYAHPQQQPPQAVAQHQEQDKKAPQHAAQPPQNNNAQHQSSHHETGSQKDRQPVADNHERHNKDVPAVR